MVGQLRVARTAPAGSEAVVAVPNPVAVEAVRRRFGAAAIAGEAVVGAVEAAAPPADAA